MARKKNRDYGGGYSWMDTYGDMVTLLLTFFIMLFSMSTVNEEKWEVLIRAFTKNPDASTAQIILIAEGEGEDIAPAVGADPQITQRSEDNLPDELSQLYDYIKTFIEQNDLSSSVSVSKDASNNVYIRFDNSIFFDGDSYALKEESFPILDYLGDCLKSVEDEIFITRVNGHTAAIPGNEDYHISDWTLSGERASQVVIYLEEHKDLNPKKLMCNGYGKNYPVDTNETAEGRANNRRVEIMILGNHFDVDNPDDLYSLISNLVNGGMTETVDPSAPPDIIEQEMGNENADIIEESDEEKKHQAEEEQEEQPETPTEDAPA